jgi:AcrR family transcriptional regulator
MSVVTEPSAPARRGGVRQRARSRLRAHIVETGLRLFLADGYDKVTTQEIAEACGVTQRTLFRHFPRKDMIVSAGGVDYAGAFDAFLTENIDRYERPVDAVLAGVMDLAAFYDENRRTISAAYAIVEQSAYLKTVARANQLEIDRLAALAIDGPAAFHARDRDPSLAARTLAALILSAVRPSIRAWLKGELSGSMRRYAALNVEHLRPLVAAGETYARALETAFAAEG